MLLLQVKKFGELRNYANIINNTKEILKSIYAKIKKQKQSEMQKSTDLKNLYHAYRDFQNFVQIAKHE